MHESDPYLMAGGWYEGRRVPIDADLAALRSEGYDVWPEAEAFLGEYSMMTILIGRDGLLYGGVDSQLGRLGSTVAEVIVTTLLPEHPEQLNMPLDP